MFVMPNQDGIVTVTAPGCHPEPGCFYPGTTILIINSGNGVVLSLTAGNNGEINSELPATINDRMLITITDPFGNQTTFEKSQYVNPVTGETAVGAGGGTVEGPGGVELRIPEGALDKALVLKIEGFDEASLPYPAEQQPGGGPGSVAGPANFGSGIKIRANGEARFKKEVKRISTRRRKRSTLVTSRRSSG